MDAAPAPAGTQFGPYRLEAIAGSGGMGVVYRAVDERLGRTVAVKFITAAGDADAQRRFRREGLTASRLNHPHILSVYDAGELDGRAYLVTEFIEGTTLGEWLGAGPREWRDVIDLLVGVADALATAHAAGIVHRDVKPGNILVSGGYAKLADFGLARPVTIDPDAATQTIAAEHTRPGVVAGTLGYMAPEQLAGAAVDHRADIFAFGAVLYEALEGRRAFVAATDVETMARIRDHAPALTRAGIPAALHATVAKALHKDPAARYQSMRELVSDLRLVMRVPEVRPPRRVRTAAAVAALGLVSLAAWAAWPRPELPAIRSLAVLPLRNLSGDAGQEYFADGTTEQLISDLSQIGALKVTSRTSVMAYKATTWTIPQIAAALGVDAVLEGAVQRMADRVHITVRLIDAASDRTLWNADIDRAVTDTLTVQADIATAIAAAIHLPLSESERTRLQGRRISPEALDAYLRGRALTWNFNVRDQAESIRYFEAAARAQPDFAAAHAGVAAGWVTLVNTTGGGPPEAKDRARVAAARALDLDPALPDPHIVMADVLMFDWKWAEAEREFRRAIALDSRLPDGLNDYAFFLLTQGRLREAREQIDRAVALDALSAGIFLTQGVALAAGGQEGQAEQAFRRALDLDPENRAAANGLVTLKERQGDAAGALALLRQQFAASGADLMRSALAGRLLAETGQANVARRVLRNVSGTPGTSATTVAGLELALGDREAAIARLQAAVASRSMPLTVKIDSGLLPLHGDPRFAAVLRQMGLPPD